LDDLIPKTKDLFLERFGRSPEITAAAPGRANLIGEHTDYNDGHVLPVAIDRFTVAAVANRPDRRFRLYTANLDASFEFDADDVPTRRPGWASYMMGVVAEIEVEGFPMSGKDMLVYGNVPLGSGISSSASLEVSTATALERIEGFCIDDERMVRICRRADHRFVGVKSGPMDQFASRACRSGHAGLLDCRSLEMTHHRLPFGFAYLSVYSGIPRSLAASEYNERQASCQEAVVVLRELDSGISSLRDVSPELLESAKARLNERVYRRARHVVIEERRVFDLVEAFQKRDANRAGALLFEGHRSLSEDYEVSLPILDEMVDWLYSQNRMIGARLTGAGFGGSLICMVEEGMDVAGISAAFVETFGKRTPEPPHVWKLKTVDGARYQPSL
jgi:galactokinase